MPFLDLHAHFPIHHEIPDEPAKRLLFDFFNRTLNYEGLQPRVSLKRWFGDKSADSVTGFASVLYDPQDEFFVDAKPRPEAFGHILDQMDRVEAEIRNDGRVAIARNPAQVEVCLKEGRKFLFHTLEGGYSLGGKAGNVKVLADRGVASIIPAHLFYRAVATCENAFPPAAELIFARELASQPKIGLSGLGKRIVEACFQHGVLVDITHAREDAQRDIFEIARGYKGRPLISSHNSVRGIFDAGLNLSDGAIRQISQSNGVIGVIFYPHWLGRHGEDDRGDFELLAGVIDYIHARTGTYENIGIGSDLDGFIDPIALCSNYGKMSALPPLLKHRYGQKAAEMILYRNALRVLQAGWSGVQ